MIAHLQEGWLSKTHVQVLSRSAANSHLEESLPRPRPFPPLHATLSIACSTAFFPSQYANWSTRTPLGHCNFRSDKPSANRECGRSAGPCVSHSPELGTVALAVMSGEGRLGLAWVGCLALSSLLGWLTGMHLPVLPWRRLLAAS